MSQVCDMERRHRPDLDFHEHLFHSRADTALTSSVDTAVRRGRCSMVLVHCSAVIAVYEMFQAPAAPLSGTASEMLPERASESGRRGESALQRDLSNRFRSVSYQPARRFFQPDPVDELARCLTDERMENPVEVIWRNAGHIRENTEREFPFDILLHMIDDSLDPGFVFQ